jgi:hypothetical protein
MASWLRRNKSAGMTLFNSNPRFQLVDLPGHKPCIVVDNFLQHPEQLIRYACDQKINFSAPSRNAYPGIELQMPDDFSARLNDFFILHIKNLLGARRTVSMYSRLSMITLQPHELAANQRVCHQDQLNNHPQHCFAASVLYLFNNPAMGGTSFYRPKSVTAGMAVPDGTAHNHGYFIESNSEFELICTIPPAWNRIIFYDGTIFHSAHITKPELLNANPLQGRLTLNGFFTCRKSET